MIKSLFKRLLEEMSIVFGFEHKTSRKVAFYGQENDILMGLAIEFCSFCPSCERKMPNSKWRRKKGCKWCQK